MSAEVLARGGPPEHAPEGRAGAGAPAGRLSWHGVRTVAVLELRQRVRSTRWVWILAVWAVVLGLLTALIRYSVFQAVRQLDAAGAPLPQQPQAGATMFGLIAFLVLGLAGLVAPALSATSVNGDRQAGVLATLQTTLLSAPEIVLGKLLAAWLTALALLGAGLPFIAWAYLEGGTSIGRLLTTLLLLAVSLGLVCAIGLGWSAISSRTSSSAVLTYLTVALLGLGLPLLFALTVPLVTEQGQVTQLTPAMSSDGVPADGPDCDRTVVTQDVLHTERTWWLLAPSPFVVVADAAPQVQRYQRDAGGRLVESSDPQDPLSVIRYAVRSARVGPTDVQDFCHDTVQQRYQQQQRVDAAGVVWPYGLAADLVLALGFVWLAVRRVSTPTRRLPSGTRVA